MLPKSFRLPSSVKLSSTHSFHHPLFSLKYSHPTQSNPRFGIVISKKIDKRATARNRMRRLLQTYIQSNLTLFPARDYVFIVKKTFDELTEQDAKQLQIGIKGITNE